MHSGEVKLLSLKKFLLRVWTATQYQVHGFRSDKVTRLALQLRFRTFEDCGWESRTLRVQYVARLEGG